MELLNTIQGRGSKWVVSFVTTCISSLFWPELPPPIILPLFIFVAVLAIKFPHGIYLSGGLVGIVWMASVGHWQVNWQLPNWEIRQITQVTGSIDSIVYESAHARFNFKLSHTNQRPVYTKPIIRLSWRHAHAGLKQGQKLQLSVKLKSIGGLANEGGFSYQQWLIANRIVATGYVLPSVQPVIIDDSITIRQKLIDKITAMPLKNLRWIIALSLGERGLFTGADWSLLQETGTAHLMAISGLHLGIVMTICYAIFSLFLKVVSLFNDLPQYKNYYVYLLFLVCISSFVYASLAGLGLPVFRAFLMITIWSVLTCSHRFIQPLSFLVLCVSVFVILQPLSLLSASFWLSFSAVLSIAFICWRWPINRCQQENLLQKTLRMTKRVLVLQGMLSLLLIPVVAVFFSMLIPSSSIINIFAIPIISFVLVPICLLGIVLLPISYSLSFTCFSMADAVLEFCLLSLTRSQNWLPPIIQIPGIPLFAWLLLICWILACMLPLKLKFKFVGSVLCLPLLSHLLPNRASDWHLHTLDVGHGLAVVVERNNRALVYDVGAAFESGFNMADSVLLPFLNHRGIRRIDWLFISHSDNDHQGALPYVLQKIPVLNLSTSKENCHRGLNLNWQGLDIKGLWPHPSGMPDGNDGSCIIKLSDLKHSVLIPGDVSYLVERQLVDSDFSVLESDILIAGHHGSQTSSSAEFVAAVKPSHVIFSHGQHARWGFPAQQVVNRFVKHGAVMHSTLESGQISVTFNANSSLPVQVRRYRQHIFPVWYNRRYGLAD